MIGQKQITSRREPSQRDSFFAFFVVPIQKNEKSPCKSAGIMLYYTQSNISYQE